MHVVELDIAKVQPTSFALGLVLLFEEGVVFA